MNLNLSSGIAGLVKRSQNPSKNLDKIQQLMLALEKVYTGLSHVLPNQIFREKGGCRFLLPNQTLRMVSDCVKPLRKATLLGTPFEIEEACMELVTLAEALNKRPQHATDKAIDDAFLCAFALSGLAFINLCKFIVLEPPHDISNLKVRTMDDVIAQCPEPDFLLSLPKEPKPALAKLVEISKQLRSAF
jgi:hypothetical protein